MLLLLHFPDSYQILLVLICEIGLYYRYDDLGAFDRNTISIGQNNTRQDITVLERDRDREVHVGT